MGRKGQSITLSLREEDKASLEDLAQEFGLSWGDRPNISKLIKAIAQHRLRIAPNHYWSHERITALDLAMKVMMDMGRVDEALTIAQLLTERGEISIPLLQELHRFLQSPQPSWRQSIDQMIRRRHAFQLMYQDVADRSLRFTIRYGEVVRREKRLYLDCWCEETEGNHDLEPLQHNWSLRLDRIQEAAIIPRDLPWRPEGLDRMEVKLHLVGGLAINYEPKTADVDQEWLEIEPPLRQVVRRVSSSFWFRREILPYGADCWVVEPKGLREVMRAEIREMGRRYGLA